ncbi:hypothetical protein FPZ12_020280 [Amycolatopsis acidicola]|uniref:Uncharacterized protein n=1 Tax=Amycolatopsis acidicola TaxID=2596893 RepID=A0A5N0V3D8_9PSEU|nr:hypothetical protein [Amycolatopsis acidicola]KAA9159442.1 hypothetical protein FPZ12_020280 [Amycolatopsis acidicola]
MDIQAFAAAMTESLEGTWAVEPGDHGHRDRYLIGPEREQLHVLYVDWEETPRLKLSASLPGDLAKIRYRYGKPIPCHEITVSPNTTPETVAADITRQLLPGYRVTLTESRELKQRLDEQAATRDRLAGDIAAPLGATVHHPEPSALEYDPQVVRYTGPLAGTATVPCTGRHVTFTFTVTPECAAEVAAFLARFPSTDQPTEPERDTSSAPTKGNPPPITRDQVSCAINDGADLVINELTTSDRDHDLINLVVNAALTRLDSPAADLDQVITACYDSDPADVRSWWGDWC